MSSLYACLLFFAGLQIGISTTVPSRWVPHPPQRIIAVIHESSVQVTNVGSTVRYHCFGRSKGNDTISADWQKENGQLPSGRSYVDTSGTLIIRDVKGTDSGVYICQVSDGVNMDTQKLNLIVDESCVDSPSPQQPTPTITPVNWIGKSGDTVHLLCIIPLIRARITWARSGNAPFSSSASTQNGTLMIRNASPSDSGFYICKATGYRGVQTSAVASVSIRSLTRPSVIRVDLDRQVVNEGTLVQINCVVTGDPAPCITWTKSGKPIGAHIQTEENVLRIFNSRVSDQGTYECHATNSEGSSVGQAELRVEPITATTEITVTDLPPPRIIVTISENPIRIMKVGGSVTYHCAGRSEDGRPISIKWQKESGQLPIDRGYDNRRGRLNIKDLKVSDSGIYVCQVSNGVNINIQKVTLTVEAERLVKPRPIIQPRYLTVQEGNPVEFRCEASGNPRPQLSWIRVRGEINHAAVFENGIWSLSSAKKSDEAEYKCIARNSAGVTEKRTILYVTASPVLPPKQPLPIIDPTEWIGRPGDTIRLLCTAQQNARITWTRSENAPLPASAIQQNGNLTIYSASASDSGYYICTAITYEGFETRSTARVTIQLPTTAPPRVRVDPERQEVTQGTLVEVKCIVIGDPRTVVTWTKLGEPLGAHIRTVGNTLRIINPQVSDRGVYVCRASNHGGNAQGSAVIDVKGREKPVIELYPQQYQAVTIGGSALFQCRVTGGIPMPSVSWAREDGKPFSSNVEHLPGGVLRFNSVTLEDGGSFVCTASNEVGSVFVVAILEISTPPVITITPLNHNPLLVRLSERVKLTCAASGNPKPSVRWSRWKSGGIVYPVNSDTGNLSMAVYEINSVSYDDEGSYICLATNAYGPVEKRIQIRVEDGWIERNTSTVSPISIGSQVGVSTFEKHLRVPDGGRVEMRCQVYGGDGDDINLYWKRNDGRSLSQGSTVHDGILLIPAVTKDDDGEYICEGSNINGAVLFSTTSYLEIIFPPRIELEPVQQVVRPGESPSIICRVAGDQPINIEWYAVDRPLPYTVSVDGGFLQFNRINSADGGRYICKATNDAGIAEAVAHIFINESTVPLPEPPSPIIDPTEWTGESGDTIRLVCTAPRSSRITWTRSDITPLAVSTSGILSIYNSSPSDSGYYICTATTYEGVETRSTARVTVRTSSVGVPVVRVEPEKQEVTQGTLVEVTCIVTGGPSTVVTWTKLREPLGAHIQTVGNTLSIINPQVSDRGIYVCHATKDGVYAQASAVINVIRSEMPVIELYPQKHQIVPIHGSALLQCRTTAGLPTPSVIWAREDGNPFSSNVEQLSGGILRFNRVKEQDGGSFICTASNKAGSVSAAAFLDISTPPEITISPAKPRPLSVRLGDTVRLTCTASGQPQSSVVWRKEKNGVSVHPGNSTALLSTASYEISSVSADDEGWYTCFATNDYGTVEESVQIYVEDSWVHTSTISPISNGSEVGVRITAESLRIPDGGRVKMRCEVYGSDGEDIYLYWKRNDGRSLPQQSTVRDGILLIPLVTKDDAGEYICQGQNRNGAVLMTATSYLEVIFPPRIELDPKQQFVRPGESPSIICHVTGNKPMNIEWYTVDRPLPYTVSVEGGLLQFSEINSADAGKYVCRATNDAGIAEAVAHIFINESSVPLPEPPSPIIVPTEWLGESGDTIRLVCTAPQNARISWTRSENTLLPVSASGILTIYNSSPSDSGYYICIATTYEGVETRSTARVTVRPLSVQAPVVRVDPERQDVTQGTLVEVQCIVTGDPATIVTWSKLGEPLGAHIQSVGNTLRIINTQVSDHGTYVCHATNSGGYAQASVVIDVKRSEMPVIELYPQKHQIVPIHSSALLECRIIAGHPTPSVIWTREDGNRFSSNVEQTSGGILRFNRVREQDGGSFVCSASNEAGSVSATAFLDISTPPEITILPAKPRPLSVRLGDTVRITCTASGQPQSSVVWNKQENGVSVYPGNSTALLSTAFYEISSVSADDEGWYTCFATNDYGTVEESVQIYVEDSWVHMSTISPITNGSEIGVTISANSLRIPDGGRVEMRCEVYGSDGEDIHLHWKRNDGRSLPQQSTVRDGLLLIPVFTEADAGQYICQGLNSSGTVLYTATSHLEIIFPPKIELEPVKQVVRSGESPSIICHITGDQPIDIEWYAVDRPLPHTVSQNGGLLQFNKIIPADSGEYVCKATNDAGTKDAVAQVLVYEYSNQTSENLKQCKSPNPCQHGGICTALDGGYKCDCQLGFNGPRCETIVEIMMDIAFRGDGWLELDRSVIMDEETAAVIGFEFSTNKSTGVIMWHGQTPADLNPDDYISLAVVDGYVEYQYNLGSGAAVIRVAARRVDDGERHRVILRRKGSEGTIELDEMYVENGASFGLQQLLNARGSVYLGGVPDYAMTYGKYRDGFSGCIYTLQVQESGPVIIEDKAIRGINVYPCNSELDRPPIRGDGGHVE